MWIPSVSVILLVLCSNSSCMWSLILKMCLIFFINCMLPNISSSYCLPIEESVLTAHLLFLGFIFFDIKLLACFIVPVLWQIWQSYGFVFCWDFSCCKQWTFHFSTFEVEVTSEESDFQVSDYFGGGAWRHCGDIYRRISSFILKQHILWLVLITIINELIQFHEHILDFSNDAKLL